MWGENENDARQPRKESLKQEMVSRYWASVMFVSQRMGIYIVNRGANWFEHQHQGAMGGGMLTRWFWKKG